MFGKNSSILLCLSLSAMGVQIDVTTRQRADVIASLRSVYHVECIFLVAAPGDAPMQELKETLKLLSDVHVAVTHWVGGEQLRCQRNRPLCVFLSEREALSVLGHAHLRQVPSHPRWLVFTNKTTSTSLRSAFQSLYIPFDCEFLLATNRVDHVDIFEAFKTHPGGELVVEAFGVWTEGRLHVAQMHLYERRTNLRGLTLRAVAVDNGPSVTLKRAVNGSVRLGGLFGHVWKILEARLNFTTALMEQESEVHRYGRLMPNNSWSGMIGKLATGQVDVGVAGFQILSERLDVIDFLIPIVHSSLNLMIRQPDNVAAVEWTSFLQPFSPGLWSAIFSSVALLGVALSGVRSVGRRLGNEEAESLDPADRLVDSLIQVVGLFCQQGQHNPPRAASTQFVFLLAGLTSIVYLAAYSAALISFLTDQKLQLPFETFAEFVGDGSYQLLIYERDASILMNHNSSDPVTQKVYEAFIRNGTTAAVAYDRREQHDILDRVCVDNVAYLMYKLSISISLKSLSCPVVWIPEKLVPISLAFAVAKDSPYRHILNKKLRIVWNSGVLARNMLKTWPRQESAEIFKGALTQVTFSQVVPMLALVGVGIVLSALVLGLEAVVGALKRPRGGPRRDHSRAKRATVKIRRCKQNAKRS